MLENTGATQTTHDRQTPIRDDDERGGGGRRGGLDDNTNSHSSPRVERGDWIGERG
jgi:hypothetical protein